MGRTPKFKDVKTDLLGAALDCVKAMGIQNTNSYSVTKRLKMSQPSFFYHFKGQEDFQIKLMDFVISKNHKKVEESATETKEKSNRAHLKGYISGNMQWAHLHPNEADVVFFGFLRCAQNPDIKASVNAALKRGEERLFNIIASGIADGEFKPRMPARKFTALFHKMLLGFQIQIHCFQTPQQEIKEIEDILYRYACEILECK